MARGLQGLTLLSDAPMTEDIGDVWAELMFSNPKFAVAFLGAFLFICSGDWGSLVLAGAFGHAWSVSEDNLFVVGVRAIAGDRGHHELLARIGNRHVDRIAICDVRIAMAAQQVSDLSRHHGG